MVSNTGWTSVGELEMTRRISLVAVCCSSASVRSRLRAFELGEQPHVLDRDHRLVGKGLEQRDLLLGEGPGSGRPDGDGADGTPSRISGTARMLRKPAVRARSPIA